MRNKQEFYYVTQDGYEELLDNLRKLKEKFNINEKEMSKSFQNATGDGAHDNGEFESLLLNERLLLGQIERISNQIALTKVIEIPCLESNQININESILLQISYSDGEFEEDVFKLVGTEANSMMNEISLNSPLGKAIFQRRIGDEVTYTVNGEITYVKIIEKIKDISR